MADFSAPDGSNKPLAFDTVQYLHPVPPYGLGILWGNGGNSSWEQAVVVYLNEQRQPSQIGNFHRNNLMWLPESSARQDVMLVGWHKRGKPDGSLPWVSSDGDGYCNLDIARWDDSKHDLDFDDFTVEFMDIDLGIGEGTFHGAISPTDPRYIAKALVHLAAVRESATILAADEAATVAQRMNEAQARLLCDYKANIRRQRVIYAERPLPDGKCLPDTLLIAARIKSIGNRVLEGSVTTDLLDKLPELLTDHDSGNGEPAREDELLSTPA